MMRSVLPGLLTAVVVAVLPHVVLAEEAETPAPGPARILERLKAADANGDGMLSMDEAPERLKQHFEKIDANNDGQLDAEELKRAIAAMAKKGKPGPAKFLERLKAADANGDGMLSMDEAPERLKQHFEKIDANSDGQLDAEELKQAIEALAKRGGRPQSP